jgi:hypothetical protein
MPCAAAIALRAAIRPIQLRPEIVPIWKFGFLSLSLRYSQAKPFASSEPSGTSGLSAAW